jgi:general secretion pathway protein M
MRPLSPYEKKLLAVLLLLAAVAAIVVAVAVPYTKMVKRYDDAIATSLDQLARYQRIVAARSDVQSALATVTAKDAKKFFLKTSAPAMAAADIQQIVQTLVEVNKLELESMQIAPPKNEDKYRKITLSLRLHGKLAGIQSTLYSLETTIPYLFVDNLNMQATVRQNFIPQPGVEPDVRAQFDLIGYAHVENSDAAHRH